MSCSNGFDIPSLASLSFYKHVLVYPVHVSGILVGECRTGDTSLIWLSVIGYCHPLLYDSPLLVAEARFELATSALWAQCSTGLNYSASLSVLYPVSTSCQVFLSENWWDQKDLHSSSPKHSFYGPELNQLHSACSVYYRCNGYYTMVPWIGGAGRARTSTSWYSCSSLCVIKDESRMVFGLDAARATVFTASFYTTAPCIGARRRSFTYIPCVTAVLSLSYPSVNWSWVRDSHPYFLFDKVS